MSPHITRVLLLGSWLCLPSDALAQAPARHFGLTELPRLVNVSDPQISPDGKAISIVVSRPDYDADRYRSELVVVDVATGAQRVLTPGRSVITSPRWSPSGDRLAFLAPAGADDPLQIFILPMTGGEARQLTTVPGGLQQFAWRPDGEAIAFVAADTAPTQDAIKKHEDAFEVGNNGYLEDAAPTPAHLWVVPAAGGDAHRLTSGSWSLAISAPPGPPASPLSWSPDARTIAITRQTSPFFGDGDSTVVALVDVASGAVRPLTGRHGLEGYPVFSPDGSRIAYWYPRDGDPNSENEVFVATTSGGEGRDVTRALDRSMWGTRWVDAKTLLVGANDGTGVSLWLQPLEGPARRLDLGSVVPTNGFWVDATVGPNGALAFTGTEPGRPTELFSRSSPTAPLRRLTDFNHDIAALELGKVETVAWQSDGFREDGVLVYPPRYESTKHYPLVLVIHGGPAAASKANFSILPQLLAARGWLVFSPNYRGSDNLGAAYEKAIAGASGGDGAGRDVMAGLAAVQRLASVDTTRIGVSGWSYGGFMTTWLIGHYHGWKAAVAGAAVTDEADQYNLADFNVTERYVFGGSPWDSATARAYVAHSPITYANQIRTPTLILSDRGDERVPIVQSYKLFHALKDHAVPVKFVVYPVSGHFPADPVRQRDVWRRWVGWFDQYFRPPTGVIP